MSFMEREYRNQLGDERLFSFDPTLIDFTSI